MRDLFKKLNDVDSVLQRMTIVGVMICFRSMLQEALGKLFDRTSTEYKLFKAVILDYHKQEKINKRLAEQLQNPTQIVPQVALLVEADMPTPKEQVDN